MARIMKAVLVKRFSRRRFALRVKAGAAEKQGPSRALVILKAASEVTKKCGPGQDAATDGDRWGA
jgi:hypothetical protein